MDNVTALVSTLSAIVGLIITAVTFLIKFITAVKAKNISEAARLLQIGAEEAVRFVETVKSKANGELDSQTKLTMALTRINQYCIDNNIEYNENQAIKLVEEAIKFSKEVNAREKDKEI